MSLTLQGRSADAFDGLTGVADQVEVALLTCFQISQALLDILEVRWPAGFLEFMSSLSFLNLNLGSMEIMIILVSSLGLIGFIICLIMVCIQHTKSYVLLHDRRLGQSSIFILKYCWTQ